jgi:hypothetical protein
MSTSTMVALVQHTSHPASYIYETESSQGCSNALHGPGKQRKPVTDGRRSGTVTEQMNTRRHGTASSIALIACRLIQNEAYPCGCSRAVETCSRTSRNNTYDLPTLLLPTDGPGASWRCEQLGGVRSPVWNTFAWRNCFRFGAETN